MMEILDRDGKILVNWEEKNTMPKIFTWWALPAIKELSLQDFLSTGKCTVPL